MSSLTSRRSFLQMTLAALATPAFLHCQGPTQKIEYPATVSGYRGLAELPFFEIDKDGYLALTVEDMPPTIDFHAHFGFAVGASPAIDYLKSSPKVEYLIDCDGAKPPCTFDFNVYMNEIATRVMLDTMENELAMSALSPDGSVKAKTHTLPNLLAEMDRMKVKQAVLLPIAVNLGFGRDDMTERWREAVVTGKATDRFVSFCSVHPKKEDAIAALREYHKQGFRGIKFHPTMQQTAPNDPKALALFEECDKLGMLVFFHAGRAGIEPESTRDNALLANYRDALKSFPKTQFIFGHAGARDWKDALAVAKEYPNVWMEIEGQGVSQVKEIAEQFDTKRILFGSDWPFYPLAATIAKVLIVTDGNKTLRDDILANNARRLLGIA